MLKSEDTKKWEIAMQEKYNYLFINNIWSLVPLPKGMKPIFYKWVFKFKHGVHAEVKRYKAWGFTQTFGINYNKTFACIAKFMSICCILTLVTIEDMKIQQMDVKIAFLNGDLEEEIYMEQPQGEHKEVNILCVSFTSHYMAWTISKCIFENYWICEWCGLYFYVAQMRDVKFFIVVFVNDIILVCNNKD